MPSYLILFSFTQRGLEKIKDLPARVKNAKETVRQLGGEIQAYYGILGSEYDTLLIITAPNDEKVAQMAVSISLLGNVRTQTHRLFDEQELFKIVSSLP